MEDMFADSGLTEFNGVGWDTSKVKTMSYMFANCADLTKVVLDDWSFASITNYASERCECGHYYHYSNGITGMFSGCTSLTDLSARNWDMTTVNYLNSFFRDCRSLTSIDLSNWNVSNVYGMDEMFSGCTSLTELDLSGWTVPNLSYAGSMFQNCSGLETLDLSGWAPSRLDSMGYMFAGCSSLVTLYINKLMPGSNNTSVFIFQGDSKLATIICNGNWSNSFGGSYWYNGNIFSGCSSLPGWTSSKTYYTYAKPVSEGGYFTPAN